MSSSDKFLFQQAVTHSTLVETFNSAMTRDRGLRYLFPSCFESRT